MEHFKKITYVRYQAVDLAMDVGRDVHVHANINQLSVKHDFLHRSLILFTWRSRLNPDIDIGHIGTFIQVDFHYNPMMYVDSNVIF